MNEYRDPQDEADPNGNGSAFPAFSLSLNVSTNFNVSQFLNDPVDMITNLSVEKLELKFNNVTNIEEIGSYIYEKLIDLIQR